MAKQTLEQLLEKVDKQVKAKIEKILANLTPEQRLAIIDNPAIIDDLLKDIDVQQLAKYYMTELTGIAGIVIKDYSLEIAEAQKQKVNIFVNKLLELKTDTLRQFIESNKAQFKNKIIELIINGSDRKVIKEYFAKTPFTNAQIGTLINTAESDIRRTTVLSAYEDREGMRFRYEGGLIPTSSDNCTWLIENQKEEGYLLKEIQTGIITPHGTIDWGGRVPNYNCIHFFSPILNEDMMQAELYRYESKPNDIGGDKWYSLQKDYVEQYASLKGGGDIKKESVAIKNPLVVNAPDDKFSSPAYENPIIKKAKEDGYGGVIFRNNEDEFWLKFGKRQ